MTTLARQRSRRRDPTLAQTAHSALTEARPWIERLARLGLASRGAVYVLVGVLALQAATGARARVADSHGALRAIAHQPFGQVLLALVAVGLAGYALWRLLQAIIDPEGSARKHRLLARLGALTSAVIHAGLTVTALHILAGTRETGGPSVRSWTATLMGWPFGRWLAALVGLGIVAFGLAQIWKARTKTFLKHLKTAQMSATERAWARRAGELGLAARGVVFILSGGFLVRAALDHDPREARGLQGSLETLAHQPYGPSLLSLVAVGLIAYGIYGFVQARYRRIVAL